MLGKLIRYVACMLPMPGTWRGRLYRLSGMRVGRATYIDRNVQVTGAALITIGARVSIANGVALLAEVTTGHSRVGELRPELVKAAPITIGDDAWLTVRSVILPGVSIGERAIVAAHAVVRNDVPADALVGGLPARVIRS